MIPRIIHYVWMGKGEKNSFIRQCMKTWKKRLKNYTIIEWNEETFDINSHPFVKKAYENKKWAFVSDYIRFFAVYNYGGVYLDTDVVIAKDIDGLLNNTAFVGFETPDYPFTAVFGCEKNHEFAKRVLDYYDSLDVDNFDFLFSDNNTISISEILISDYGCKTGNIEQVLPGDIKVYKSDVLCMPSFRSITIHVFTSTWREDINNNSFLRRAQLYLLTHCTNRFVILICLIIKSLIRLIRK